MKGKKELISGIIIFGLSSLILLWIDNTKQADSRVITNIPPDISANQLKAIVVEDFEKSDDWIVESIPKKNPNPKRNPVTELKLKYMEGSPSALKPERWSADKKGMNKKSCLGMHFRFKYPGYNSIHVLPPLEVKWDDPSEKVTTYDPRTGKQIQERALQLPGKAKALSIWAHGRGNDYFLECWVKDYRGEVHILKFGTLNFVGWKPLLTNIPRYIPQSIESYPQTRVLKIMRFVIRSSPDAPSEDVFMFFDQLKVLTDTYEVNFDGQNLHKAFKSGKMPGSSGPAQPSAKPGP